MTRLLRRKVPPLAVLAALLAVVSAGCGEREERVGRAGGGPAERIELMLDFFPNADHAPIYAALANGRFREVGLEVDIRQPTDPAQPIKQVAAGRVDVAISYEPEVFRAREKGQQVVSIGALVQRPLTSIISLRAAGIRRLSDLRGKRVGTAGIDYQSAFLRSILDEANVDPGTVREQNVGFGLSPALLTRKVDAVLGAFWNYEGEDLRLRGRNPHIIRVDDAGIPTYDELVFVANADALGRDDSRLRRFVAAVGRGAADLEREPRTALAALLKDNRELDRRLQARVIEVTTPLFQPPRGRPFGWHEPRDWEEFGAWMQRNGLLREAPDVGRAYTNQLLPGEGL